MNDTGIFEEERKIIKEILSEYYEESHIHDLEDSVLFPLGMINYEEKENNWGISLDYSMHFSPHDLITVAKIAKQLTLEDICFEMYEGYYTVFDEEFNYLDTIWDHDIIEYVEKNDMDYKDVAIMMYDKILEENKNKDKKESLN